MCNDEQVTQEICVISEMEVAAIIQKLTRNKATGYTSRIYPDTW